MFKLAFDKTKLKSLFLSNTFILICIFLISECIVKPTGEFALNDDWAFAKVAQAFHEQGTFNLGSYAAMTLLTHVLLGVLFTKLFGFSFFVLRFSVLCLALLTVIYFEKFIYSITKTKLVALFGALCLLFNPVFFNLSNSYMTDITFVAFFFFSIYHYHKYCIQQQTRSLIWFSLCVLAAIFTRQFAIIIPVTLFLLCGCNFIISKTKRKEFLFSIGLLAICLLALLGFEMRYIPRIEGVITYHGLFISAKSETPLELSKLIEMFTNTLSAFLFYSGLFVFPIVCFNAYHIVKKFLHSKLIISLPILLGLICFLVYMKTFKQCPTGNILYNGGLGVETSVDILQLLKNLGHARVIGFTKTVRIISVIGLFLLSLQLLSKLQSNFKFKKTIFLQHHFGLWIVLLFLSYAVLISLSFGILDRYLLLPSFLACILLINYLDFKIKPIHISTLLVFALFSIVATKDYFNYNRTNQKMVNYLTKNLNVKPQQIHAGIEYIMWNLHDDNGWELLNKCEQDYYICFGDVPNYHKIKEFKYQRYFPYREEKVYILKKD